MIPFDIDQLQPGDELLQALGSSIWIMDDHRWALYVWQRYASDHDVERFTLVHADYHWDAVNDFDGDTDLVRQLMAANLAQLKQMVQDNVRIKCDSFIAPAILRGLIKAVHFYCSQVDTEPGLGDELLTSAGAREFQHQSTEDLLRANITEPFIFDLCLDLFNKSDAYYEGDLWSDVEIISWLEQMRPLIVRAELVTVSLSFGYSGTKADTRHLAALVLPRLSEWRAAACG